VYLGRVVSAEILVRAEAGHLAATWVDVEDPAITVAQGDEVGTGIKESHQPVPDLLQLAPLGQIRGDADHPDDGTIRATMGVVDTAVGIIVPSRRRDRNSPVPVCPALS
jgi:hypothetical protein